MMSGFWLSLTSVSCRWFWKGFRWKSLSFQKMWSKCWNAAFSCLLESLCIFEFVVMHLETERSNGGTLELRVLLRNIFSDCQSRSKVKSENNNMKIHDRKWKFFTVSILFLLKWIHTDLTLTIAHETVMVDYS